MTLSNAMQDSSLSHWTESKKVDRTRRTHAPSISNTHECVIHKSRRRAQCVFITSEGEFCSATEGVMGSKVLLPPGEIPSVILQGSRWKTCPFVDDVSLYCLWHVDVAFFALSYVDWKSFELDFLGLQWT